MVMGMDTLVYGDPSKTAAHEFRYDDKLLELITSIAERQSILEEQLGQELTPHQAAAPTAEYSVHF